MKSRNARSAVLCAIILVIVSSFASSLILSSHVSPARSPSGGSSGLTADTAAAPTFDQYAKNFCSSATTCVTGTVTLTWPGDAVFAFTERNSTNTVSTVQDNHGNNLKFVKSATQGNLNVSLYEEDSISFIGTLKVWVNMSGSTTYAIQVAAIYGTSATPKDAVGTPNSGGHSTAESATVVTTVEPDMVLMGETHTLSSAPTASGGSFVLQGSSGSPSGYELVQNDTSTGSFTESATLGTAQSWAALSVAIKLGTVPSAPTGVTETAGTWTIATIGWTAPAGAVKNYTVLKSPANTCASGVAFSNAATNSYNYGLGGASYEKWVEVAAWNSTGISTWSSCTPVYTMPSPPTAPSASPASTTSITVTWTNPTTSPVSGVLNNTFVYWQAGSSCSSPALVNVGSSVTTYTKTGLTTGTQYCFYVKTLDPAGVSNATSTVTATTSQVPAAPTGLSVAVTSTTSLKPSWTNPSTGGLLNATVYYRQASTCGGTMISVSVGSAGTSDLISGLTTNLIYAFEVTVWNATGQSPDSSCATGLTASVPTAPTGLSIAITSATSLTPSWTNPTTGGLVNATVYYRQSSTCGGTMVGVSVGSAGTSKLISSLTTNLIYAFEVTVWNATGQSADSSCATGLTASVPAAPTGLSITITSRTSLTPSWTNPTTGGLVNATVYYRQSSTCGGTMIGVSVGSAGTSKLVSGLTTNLIYAFEVTVWNATGQSPDSSCATGLTASVPAAPTGLTVGTTTSTSIAISWTNPATGGLVNDTIYWTKTASCGGTLTAHSLGSVGTSYTITSLSGSTQYYIDVTVWNATGQSPASTCTSGTTGSAAPPTATGLKVTSYTTTTVSLIWSENTTGVNFTIWFGVSCGGLSGQQGAGYSLTATVGGLQTGTSYCFAVQSFNGTAGASLSTTVTQSTSPASGGGGGGGNGGGGGSGGNGTTNGTTGTVLLSQIWLPLVVSAGVLVVVAVVVAAGRKK